MVLRRCAPAARFKTVHIRCSTAERRKKRKQQETTQKEEQERKGANETKTTDRPRIWLLFGGHVTNAHVTLYTHLPFSNIMMMITQ